MEFIYRAFDVDEAIPVASVLSRRKLLKYFNRETMASVLTASEFLKDKNLPSDTPFYYASAEMENLDGLKALEPCLSGNTFDVSKILPALSTLDSFKTMRNMVSCFVAIENGLKGDNNNIVDSASALLYCAVTAPTSGPVLIGAGRLHEDGRVECGFATGLPSEWEGHPLLGSEDCAVEIFRMGVWR